METINSGRPQSDYPCGQQELYTIAETGWNNYITNKAMFIGKNSYYTDTLGTEQLALIEAARNMPDEDVRTEVHKTLRVQLIGLNVDCLVKWMDLSSFIGRGFPEDEFENKRIAAGHNRYRGAEAKNWEDSKALMTMGADFIANNAAALTAGGMLAEFPQEFTDLKTAFEAKHQLFLDAEEQAKANGDAKILANNAIYKTLMDMFEDGKRYFRLSAAIREQFTFDRLWTLVGKPAGSTASMIKLSGNASDAVTGEALANVEVKGGEEDGVTVSTDANGNYVIQAKVVDATMTVPVTASHPLYVPQTITVTLQAGKDRVLNFVLTPLTP